MKNSAYKCVSCFLILAFTLTVLCSCVSGGGFVPGASMERIAQDSKILYKDSSLIALGMCTTTHVGEDGAICSDVLLDEVWEGDRDEGIIIHCMDKELKASHRYLMYLSDKPQQYAADSEYSYQAIGDSVFEVVRNDGVRWYNDTVKLEDIKNIMAEYNDIVTVPRTTYFHTDLDMLADFSDEIFIGRINSVGAPETRTVKSNSGNMFQTSESEVMSVELTVLGSIKGKLRYGSNIEMLLLTDTIYSMLDSTTLEDVSCDETKFKKPISGQYYVFFLARTPDKKQEYYFPVNLIQGWVRINNETIIPNSANRLLESYQDLDSLVNAIKSVI